MSFLRQTDPEIFQAIEAEKKRHSETIDLIASENYPSKAVSEAEASILTSKYAEGYPSRRYYGGCENIDKVENLAVERLKELFHAEHANVQPHAGSQANMAVYYAILKFGDTAMGMDLSHGGHLTHGSKVSFSGKNYNFINYGVNKETERIDYQEIEKIAKESQPKLIVCGASAYPRIIDFERFRSIADKVGAKLMVDIAHTAGMIAAGLHPSPIPYADVVTSTTHKTLRGPRGGFILCRSELAKAIDSAVFPQMQGGPFMNLIAAKAVCFHEAAQPEFVRYQRATLDNALTLANELKKLGLHLISGGTDTHLMLVGLTSININGRDAERVLGGVGIVANRDSIPFDPLSAMKTSGIRFGTPAVTTRGFGKEEMLKIARIIHEVLTNPKNEDIANASRREVADICARFPIPGLNN
jgi:glycine hydroxymethyltransferase